jgi:hypothetical protein
MRLNARKTMLEITLSGESRRRVSFSGGVSNRNVKQPRDNRMVKSGRSQKNISFQTPNEKAQRQPPRLFAGATG